MTDSMTVVQPREYVLAKRGVPERPPEYFPRYFSEVYPDAIKDIAEDIYKAIYWRRHDQLAKDGKQLNEKDQAEQALLIANAIMESVTQADQVSEAVDRAKFLILTTVEKHKLYHLAVEEYSSLEEFLDDRLPFAKDTPEIGRLVFLLTEFIPALKQVKGFDINKLLRMRESWGRTRETVPYLRTQLNMYLATKKQAENKVLDAKEELRRFQATAEANARNNDQKAFQETQQTIEEKKELLETLDKQKEEVITEAEQKLAASVEKAIDHIVDPKIPIRGPAGISKTLLSGRDGAELVLDAEKILCSDGTAFLIIAPNGYGKAVETGLHTFVDFHIADANVLLSHWSHIKRGRIVPKKVKTPDGELPLVDTVVARYDWICPTCQTLNSEYELHEVMECKNCSTKVAPNLAEE